MRISNLGLSDPLNGILVMYGISRMPYMHTAWKVPLILPRSNFRNSNFSLRKHGPRGRGMAAQQRHIIGVSFGGGAEGRKDCHGPTHAGLESSFVLEFSV